MRLSTLAPVAFASILCSSASALAAPDLHEEITSIAAQAQGTVSVACSLPGTALDCNLNPHGHPPLQSVFKFPLALTVLLRVEQAKLTLNQPVPFLTSDLYPGTHSPLQDAHPHGGVDVPLRELLRLSVSDSDNVATDILLRTIGGPAVVQQTLDTLGFPAIHVRDSERTLGGNERLQYRNDAEPAAMVALLRRIADHSPLTPEHTALLLHWMTETNNPAGRIKGDLPPGVTVVHKTGTSDKATNDVGLLTLPNGRRLALAIFVTDARASLATREAVIAHLARAIYDAAAAAQP